MALSENFWLKGKVGYQGFQAPGTEVAASFDTIGGLLVSPYRGAYGELCRQGRVFSASAAAVTLPVNAATLASKFGVYNPPGSPVNLEIITVSAHAVLATTVVDALGVYYSNSTNATGATFTTRGLVENGLVGGPGGYGQFYSAVTHVGTPALLRLVGGWGAVTDGGATEVTRDFNGSLIIPPGTLIALAMTTAASTASGITLEMSWAEIPIQ